MALPGVAVAPPSLLSSCKSGAAVSGVVSVSLLLAGVGSAPLAPLSLMLAVLLIWLTPAGTGLMTVTAKVAEPLAPAANAPIVRVQTLPALLLGVQLQPGELAAALKTVLAGTVL